MQIFEKKVLSHNNNVEFYTQSETCLTIQNLSKLNQKERPLFIDAIAYILKTQNDIGTLQITGVDLFFFKKKQLTKLHNIFATIKLNDLVFDGFNFDMLKEENWDNCYYIFKQAKSKIKCLSLPNCNIYKLTQLSFIELRNIISAVKINEVNLENNSIYNDLVYEKKQLYMQTQLSNFIHFI